MTERLSTQTRKLGGGWNREGKGIANYNKGKKCQAGNQERNAGRSLHQTVILVQRKMHCRHYLSWRHMVKSESKRARSCQSSILEVTM